MKIFKQQRVVGYSRVLLSFDCRLLVVFVA